MTLKIWLASMLGAATLGLVATTSAQAAPTGGTMDLKSAAAQMADVQPAHYYGHRRYYRPYYDHYPRYRYRHRYYRPGFRFHYGPRYHRRHWHHRHW
jgi:hypothetical protein